ncbi:hypothetical protein KBB08_02605 [Candidatus Gracilibacteria bacterium]|nr:hypothetical protein [Candidatus Gracilibacteria bacterium]
MTRSHQLKSLISVGVVLLLSACGQDVVIKQAPSPTTAQSDAQYYSSLERPVNFSFSKDWVVESPTEEDIMVYSPTTMTERKGTAPAARGVEGDAAVEAFGKPDVQISFYANIADEPVNKAGKYNAKNLTELLSKSGLVKMGETMVDGKKAFNVCDGEMLCQNYWYVETTGGLYRIYFGKQVNPENISYTSNEKLITDTLKLWN